MCRNLVSLCVALLLLGLGSLAFAEEVQINGWETGLEGWSVYTDNGGVGTLTTGTTRGATEINYSLRVQTPESWWNEVIYIDIAKEGFVQAMKENYAFSIDVAHYADEWTDSGLGWAWDDEIALIINPRSVKEGYVTNWWNLGFQGRWSNAVYSIGGTGPDGDRQDRLVWDYSSIKDYINWDSAEFRVVLVDRYMHYSPGGSFYLDNAWFVVPEPATIALFGLGGLALLRRKS